MNTLDVLLINIISYMSGVFTGLLFCCKYTDRIIKKHTADITSSAINNNPVNLPIAPNYQNSPPLMASAPQLTQKEIKIVTTE
tara:strand:- start:72 stop:320 length:249 start_codon:yes stop_codon:yes gene_type:complete